MILTTAYFPSLLYFRLILSNDRIEIEACENFQKQTQRNRFLIASDKGAQTLTMPVHAHNNIPVRDVKVDYSMPWQREHLRAIETCYGSAPYYPYVIDKIQDLFSTKDEWLLDYNMRILERLLEILHIKREVLYTTTFQPILENDARLITSRNFKDPSAREYYQVFSEKIPFIPNLSIIDYMMCEGFSVNY